MHVYFEVLSSAIVVPIFVVDLISEERTAPGHSVSSLIFNYNRRGSNSLEKQGHLGQPRTMAQEMEHLLDLSKEYVKVTLQVRHCFTSGFFAQPNDFR